MVNKEIREITSRFVEVLHPEQVILFGSYATDTYHDDSDYDFYIVMADGSGHPLDLAAEAYLSICRCGRGKSVDILVGCRGEYEKRRCLPTLEREIFQTGQVLYEK